MKGVRLAVVALGRKPGQGLLDRRAVLVDDANPREERRLAAALWIDGAGVDVPRDAGVGARAGDIAARGFGALDARRNWTWAQSMRGAFDVDRRSAVRAVAGCGSSRPSLKPRTRTHFSLEVTAPGQPGRYQMGFFLTELGTDDPGETEAILRCPLEVA